VFDGCCFGRLLLWHEEADLDLGIAGKVAVVIGGESGIGAACVKVLAQEGSIISSWDLQCKQSEDAISRQVVDVTKSEQVQAAWNDTEERLGPVDIFRIPVHQCSCSSLAKGPRSQYSWNGKYRACRRACDAESQKWIDGFPYKHRWSDRVSN
jgi:hypothetical protein